MPERRCQHCTLRNSPFNPTVPKRAGIDRVIACSWAKLGGNAAPKTLMETAPPNLKLGFDRPRQVFSQGLVGWRRWRGQKIDSVLDTLKLHASFDYTEASMKWKRRVRAKAWTSAGFRRTLISMKLNCLVWMVCDKKTARPANLHDPATAEDLRKLLIGCVAESWPMPRLHPQSLESCLAGEIQSALPAPGRRGIAILARHRA